MLDAYRAVNRKRRIVEAVTIVVSEKNVALLVSLVASPLKISIFCQVMLAEGSRHIAGSPLSLHVSPGPSSPKTSVCSNCLKVFSSQANMTTRSSRTIRLSAR